jgi:hypothetical protein
MVLHYNITYAAVKKPGSIYVVTIMLARDTEINKRRVSVFYQRKYKKKVQNDKTVSI